MLLKSWDPSPPSSATQTLNGAKVGVCEGNRGPTRAAGQTHMAQDAQGGAETKPSPSNSLLHRELNTVV